MNTTRMKVILSSVILALSLFTTSTVWSSPARFAVSPDQGLPFVLSAIEMAQTELIINIYSFKEPVIREAVIAKIESGVRVRILMEGQINYRGEDGNFHTGMNASGVETMRLLRDAIIAHPGENELHILYVDHNDSEHHRRYVFDHAKFMVIDGQWAFISSENFDTSNHPAPGMKGNRGWHVLLQDAGIVQSLKTQFDNDTSFAFGDIRDLVTTGWLPVADAPEEPSAPEVRSVNSIQEGQGEVESASLITPPQAVEAMTALLSSARTKTDFQFLNLPNQWRNPRNTDGTPGSYYDNPLVAELIAGAVRGITTRVLLNDDMAFARPGENLANLRTVCRINQEAQIRNITGVLSARIVDRAASGITYIHNKGILIDDDIAFVSSINGSQNSITNNREVGIRLVSPDANAYYRSVFDSDWSTAWTPTAEQCAHPVAP